MWTLPLLTILVGKHRVFDSATHARILYRMKTKGRFFKLCEFFLPWVKFRLSIWRQQLREGINPLQRTVIRRPEKKQTLINLSKLIAKTCRHTTKFFRNHFLIFVTFRFAELLRTMSKGSSIIILHLLDFCMSSWLTDILCQVLRLLVWSDLGLFVLRLLNFTLCRSSEELSWCAVNFERAAIRHVCQLLVLPYANTLTSFELFTSRIAVGIMLV